MRTTIVLLSLLVVLTLGGDLHAGGWGANMTTCANTAGDIMIGSGGAAFGCIAPGSNNQVLTMGGSVPVWANLPPTAENCAAASITSTLSTVATITLTVASGQTARLWTNAWVVSSDSNNNIIDMEVGATTIAQHGISNSGGILSVITFGGMTSDTTAGTNTYNLRMAGTQAFGVGGIVTNKACIRGQVTNN